MFQSRSILSIEYPERNRVHSVITFRPRKFELYSVRDLVQEPLTVQEYLRRPMVRRSRFLLQVLDCDKKQWRKIYWRSIREQFADIPHRIGLFSSRLEERIGSGFGTSYHDRLALARVLARWQHEDFGTLRIGIYCDDLRVIECASDNDWPAVRSSLPFLFPSSSSCG